MPLSTPVARRPLHSRQVQVNGALRDDGLWDIEGHLVDTKSYGFDNAHRGHVDAGEPVHEMWIRLTIDNSMTIKAVEAVTDHGPYAMCPDITPNFQRLVGLTIRAGFRRQVLARLGGVNGCTHLVELLWPMATTAYQTMTIKRREERQRDASTPPPLLDSCHAHARSSVVVKQFWPEHYAGDA